MKVTVVIPVYKSANTLEELCSRLSKTLIVLTDDYEVILVDDASPDNSWGVMRDINSKNKNIKILSLTKNFGQHPAILCGLHHITGDIVITMDDDLQHPPEEIPKLINALLEDNKIDVVIGRYLDKKHNFIRNFGTFVINVLTSKIFNKDRNLKLTSFRAMRAVTAQNILKYKTVSPRIGQILLMVTNNIVNVNVRHDIRKTGKSGYSLSRLFKDFLDNILSNSALPLKLVTYIGFISFAFAIFLTIVYLYKYFFVGIQIQGWTTVILLLLTFFGFLFFSIGIIGEYLIRILKESKSDPQYLIREKIL
jgi:polyisoprenyl-phosphate glycosyltransferase